MAADLNELILLVLGQPLALAAGAVAALYSFLMVMDAIRRVFSGRG